MKFAASVSFHRYGGHKKRYGKVAKSVGSHPKGNVLCHTNFGGKKIEEISFLGNGDVPMGNLGESANNPTRNEMRTQQLETVFRAINELHEATNKQLNEMQTQIQAVGGAGGSRQSILPE